MADEFLPARGLQSGSDHALLLLKLRRAGRARELLLKQRGIGAEIGWVRELPRVFCCPSERLHSR